jgi:nucleotide-binding universal stress UspA family protein
VVVVGVEGSTSSAHALRAAADLAAAVDGELVAVHVMGFHGAVAAESTAAASSMDAVQEDQAARAREVTKLTLAPYRMLWRFEVRHGHIPNELQQAATGLNADCIVLGRRQHNRLVRLLAGSIVHRIVDDAICPVLVVPPPS